MIIKDNMKVTEFLKALGLILVFSFFAILILIISLSKSGFNQNLPIWIFIFIPFFFIIAFEGLFYKVMFTLEMDESKMKDWRTNNIITNISSFFAKVRQLKTSLVTLFGIITGIILLALLVYIGYLMLEPGIFFSAHFFIIIGVYLLYFIFRGQIGKLLGKDSSILTRFAIPEYTVFSDKITLNIKIQGLKDQSKNFLTFKFKELDDVKILTGQEIRSFVRYRLGPDVNLQMKETKQLYQYLKGEIPRLNYYFSQGIRAPLHHNVLVLRGKEILFIVPIGDRSGEDILKAFDKRKIQGL